MIEAPGAAEKFSIAHLLFSFQGRIGRRAYLGGSLLATFGTLLLFLCVALALNGLSEFHGYGAFFGARGRVTSPYEGWLMAFGVVAGIIMLWASLAVGVKRAHDLDLHGAWILVAIIPYVGVLMALYLLFASGSEGPNTYGTRRSSAT